MGIQLFNRLPKKMHYRTTQEQFIAKAPAFPFVRINAPASMPCYCLIQNKARGVALMTSSMIAAPLPATLSRR
jgi:hypothetical protein